MTASAMVLAGVLGVAQVVPSWREQPLVNPSGEKAHTGAYVVKDRAKADWKRPKLRANDRAAAGRKAAKVVVVIYDPIIESEGGKSLRELVGGTDPVEASRILVDVVREASWGYINYEIVDVIKVDGFPVKVDGFRYDDASYLAARKLQKWQPATISYRKVFEENHLVARCKNEGITEIWLWGCDGMHFDEFAGYIPNRYARFGPTENPWLYRPYDIPPELGRTTWVMGFNVMVGPDNMLHSYAHRVESMAALGVADGVWNPKEKSDPWNVFSRLEIDFPGRASEVGNCHVPPNGKDGYDYNNPRKVPSRAWWWWRFPDVRGAAEPISSLAWGNSQFGYQKWLLERVPKGPGRTEFGYNNWWLYIANTDEELPELTLPPTDRFRHGAPDSEPRAR